MEKAGFDLGPLVWEVRDSVWDPWLEKTGADPWPLVWRNLVSVLVFGVRSSGVTLGLGTQVLLPGPAFVQNPNRSFTFVGSFNPPPRLRSFKLCTTREGRAAMPKKRELPASSDVSGQDMPTTEAPWNHKVMDYIAEVFIWFIPTTGVPLLFYRLPRNARGHRQPRRSLRREHRISSTGKHHALQFGSPQASMF